MLILKFWNWKNRFDDDKFRNHLLEGIKSFSRRPYEKTGPWEQFQEHLFYLQMDAGTGEKKILPL
jgi:glucose-6-phosphate 1-dehydrogenase